MSKTFRQLFEEVQDPWGKLAIQNMEEQHPELLDTATPTGKHTAQSSLSQAFVFNQTPQGHAFWSRLTYLNDYNEQLREDLNP